MSDLETIEDAMMRVAMGVQKGKFLPHDVHDEAVDLAAWHAQQVEYTQRVQKNVEAAARASGPVEWTEPLSGKKLLNEAAVAQQVEAATPIGPTATLCDSCHCVTKTIGRFASCGKCGAKKFYTPAEVEAAVQQRVATAFDYIAAHPNEWKKRLERKELAAAINALAAQQRKGEK